MVHKQFGRIYITDATFTSPAAISPVVVNLGDIGSIGARLVDVENAGTAPFFVRGVNITSPTGFPPGSPWAKVIEGSGAQVMVFGGAGEDVGLEFYMHSQPRFISKWETGPVTNQNSGVALIRVHA